MDPQIAELLRLDVPAHLGTIDREGYPRITPIWFVYEDRAFYMTSLVAKRQVEDLPATRVRRSASTQRTA